MRHSDLILQIILGSDFFKCTTGIKTHTIVIVVRAISRNIGFGWFKTIDTIPVSDESTQILTISIVLLKKVEIIFHNMNFFSRMKEWLEPKRILPGVYVVFPCFACFACSRKLELR